MLKDVGKYFDKLIEQHGSSILGLDYSSSAQQLLRFQMIADGIGNIFGKSVLDIGCGFADLRVFLQKTQTLSFSYTGVDASKEVVDIARKMQPTMTINHCMWPADGFSKHSVVVMNGLLYLYPFVKAMDLIDAAWEATKEVLIFDCQSTMSDHRAGKDEYHYEPHRVLHWCQTYSSYVMFRHEKSQNFFMVYLYREKR